MGPFYILPGGLQLALTLHHDGLLNVRVDDSDGQPLLCQVVGEEDAQGAFSYPSFLVGEYYDSVFVVHKRCCFSQI